MSYVLKHPRNSSGRKNIFFGDAVQPQTPPHSADCAGMEIVLFRAGWIVFLVLAIWASSATAGGLEGYMIFFAAVSTACFFCAEIDSSHRKRRVHRAVRVKR